MVDTILWDIDGTLLNFELAEHDALSACLAAYGIPPKESLLRRYQRINQRHWEALERGELTREQVMLGRFQALFQEEGIQNIHIPDFNAAYQRALGEQHCPNDDGVALVARLKGRVRQYAVTNGGGAVQNRKLRLSGLDVLLDGVFISEELGAEKPSPVFFDGVFAAIGPLDKAKAVIIGDSLSSDMRGGQRAGLRCWWYNPAAAPRPADILIERELRDLRETERLLNA